MQADEERKAGGKQKALAAGFKAARRWIKLDGSRISP
jgi:hypothetical protein